MSTIVPPTASTQDEPRPNHPDLPEMGDDEEFVDYLTRVGDFLIENPPAAPPGFVLVECGAQPRHWPEYRIAEDVFYPAPCSQCQHDATWESLNEARCKLEHRRWKSWGIWWHISSLLYSLGFTATGGGAAYGRCKFCGIGRQHMAPRWRGRRPYILGVSREVWSCLLKGRHRYRLHYPSGLCATCCPCPECGSTDQDHYTCEVGA